MIRFSCGNCGKKYVVMDEIAGRIVRCSGCDREFQVPGRKAQEADSVPERIPPPLPEVRAGEPESYESTGIDAVPQSAPSIPDTISNANGDRDSVSRAALSTFKVDMNRLIVTVALTLFGCLLVFLFARDKGLIPASTQNSVENSSSHLTREVSPLPPSSFSGATKDPVIGFAEQFRDNLFRAAVREQERQRAAESARWESFDRNLGVCGYCKGAGSYNYVDQTGTLKLAICPSCHGSGRLY
jgi:hypothetical protein